MACLHSPRLCNVWWQRIGLSFCSAGLPPGLRKTCGTFFRSAKIRGSPHKPRGPALQIKKYLIAFGVFALAVLLAGTVTAQIIHLKTRDFEPQPDRTGYTGVPLQRRSSETSHYLVQFNSPLRAEMFARLRERGITVTAYLPRSALMIAAPDDFSLRGLPIRWIGRLEHRDKISPLIVARSHLAGTPAFYVVEFHSDVDMNDARAMVRERGLRLIENRDLAAHHLLVKGWFGDLSRLAAWDEVAYVFPASPELAAGVAVRACAGAVVDQTTVPQWAISAQGWPLSDSKGLVLGYVFSQLSEKLPPAGTKAEILRAFSRWSAITNVNFVSGLDPLALRTVNILFARGAHGDSYPFDGSGKVLAHTFYPAPPNPEPIAGDMHLDAGERWQFGANTDVFSAVLHETGHALGLGHSDHPGDAMYPYYRLQTGLSDGDIAAVRHLYGVRAASTPDAPVSDMPPPSSGPLVLTVQSPAPASTTTASSIAIFGSASGGTGSTQVTWENSGGQDGFATGSPAWSIGAVPLTLGENTITITAADAANDLSSQTIAVTRLPGDDFPPVAPPIPQPTPTPPPAIPPTPPAGSPADSTPPSLLITYPASTILSTSAGTIAFQGLSSDNVGVTSVTWTNSAGGAGTATGTMFWKAEVIPLLQGTNNITITAFDAAGNSAWRSTTVVRQ